MVIKMIIKRYSSWIGKLSSEAIFVVEDYQLTDPDVDIL